MVDKLPHFELAGRMHLRENYFGPKTTTYHAIVGLTVTAPGISYPDDCLVVDIPISQAVYDQLKASMEDSRFEKPVLRTKGSLEVTVEGVSIN